MGNVILFIVKFYLSIWFLLTISVLVYVCLYNWLIPSYGIDEAIFFHHDVACTQMFTTLYNNLNHHQPQHQYSSSSTYRPLPLPPSQQKQYEKYEPSTALCQNVYYDVPNKSYRQFFHSGHVYYFELHLRMPDSQANRNLGMFMIRLQLFDQDDNELFEIYRPAILPYNSWLLSAAKMIAYIPLYLVGWLTEIYSIQVKLLDEYADIERLDFSLINHIRIEIETLKPIEIIPPSLLRISVHLQDVDDRVAQFFNDSSIFDQPDSTTTTNNHDCQHHLLQARSRSR
ncbi:Berardinelli-Seip congenital lipodystrophy 2 (seipin) [Dermatophagoides farinae]|uniref:Seipin n=1 Tax=Dermatophagoides farinae TaxID=6954 RepID=A0A922IEW0_DERFA|nr:Berardinelli-Seip congenital lipodystrophy 2 (seipin) [Dermatophagoides farinae]